MKLPNPAELGWRPGLFAGAVCQSTATCRLLAPAACRATHTWQWRLCTATEACWTCCARRVAKSASRRCTTPQTCAACRREQGLRQMQVPCGPAGPREQWHCAACAVLLPCCLVGFRGLVHRVSPPPLQLPTASKQGLRLLLARGRPPVLSDDTPVHIGGAHGRSGELCVMLRLLRDTAFRVRCYACCDFEERALCCACCGAHEVIEPADCAVRASRTVGGVLTAQLWRFSSCHMPRPACCPTELASACFPSLSPAALLLPI